HYTIACVYLRRRFGIVADGSCCDWTRLFRLPHATREPEGRPENWPEYLDPYSIGPLEIHATHEDVETARASTRTFDKSRELVFTGGGDGLLYHLLRARGDVGGEAPRGGWICRCP